MSSSVYVDDYPQQDCSLYSSRAELLRVIGIRHLDALRCRYTNANLVDRSADEPSWRPAQQDKVECVPIGQYLAKHFVHSRHVGLLGRCEYASRQDQPQCRDTSHVSIVVSRWLTRL
jgi:hypothetical protein